ncbi:AMP-binding enzyme [Actinomadura soli]|nr:hypothetical protein [Actinomadura soli]
MDQAVARARQHSVGNLLHRTARRYPDKVAVVSGQRRVTFAEFDAAVNDVSAHVRERLAGYKRPKYVVFADSLPKNPSGKILKRELRARHGGLAES